MRGGAVIGRSWLVPLMAAALVCLPASAPAAQSMAVQPDGKIVLLGRTSPEAGALARLNPDGSLDQSFGRRGFVIDHRAPSFAALALQPDGRIVVGAAGGAVLARYLPDGAPDPSFDGDGIGGTPEPMYDHSDFTNPYDESSPVVVKVQSDGTIAMADTPSLYSDVGTEARVRRYGPNGEFLETAGRLAQKSRVAIADLVEGPDGSLSGAGWALVNTEGGASSMRPLLARFLPGTGLDFDPGFGAPVRPHIGPTPELGNRLEAVAAVGDKLLVAGKAEKTFLLARFDRAGNLDPSFSEDGFVAPKIDGTAEDLGDGWEEPRSWAHDMDLAADGDVVLGGGTTQWGKWSFSKALPRCEECTQPMLARFDSSGHLDPSFGDGGPHRLALPDGKVFEGQIDQVVALDDGKILVAGRVIKGEWGLHLPFVARLREDGSYDPAFGDGGLVRPEFPCTVQSLDELQRDGCVATTTMTLHLRNLRRGFPVLSVHLHVDADWAGIESVFLDLPRGIRATPKLPRRMRITAVGSGGGKGVVHDTSSIKSRSNLLFQKFGVATDLRIKLRGGSLRTFGRKRLHRRSLRLRASVFLTHPVWGTNAGWPDFVQRVTEQRGP